MRKRNIKYTTDTIFWYIIYLLPVLILLLSLLTTPLADVVTIVENSTFAELGNTFIFQTLDDIFGINGVLPLFTGTTNVFVLYYMTYFVSVMLLHLLVDFILFIPRLAHKFLGKLWGGKDD